VHITYNGPHDEVEIPSLGVAVKRGESIDVFSDDTAARLIEQSCWDAPPAEVLGWVGKDQQRAAAMLRAEQDGAQRPELLSDLDRIVNPPASKPATAKKPEVKQDKGVDD